MGLENGIKIKVAEDSKITLNSDFICSDYEPCYWRKCWGLREDILHYLSDKYEETEEEGRKYPLDATNLYAIYGILNRWCHKKKWNSESRSIWGWKTMKEQLRYDCSKIAYLIAKKEEYGDDIKIYFYDSY